MYGIPGRMPTKRRGEWFGYAPDVYQQADATEDALDLALAATFPASDALSITQSGGGSPRPRKEVWKMNLASGIRLTHLDANRLGELAKESLRRAKVLADAGRTLLSVLNSARVVAADAILADVVTMNSTVILEDRASGKRKEATVVYPIDADPARGKLSVFSPVGRTLLGLRLGDEADLPAPYESAGRIKVIKILYQPEAAGNFAL